MKAYDLLSSFENIHDKYIMEAKDMEKYREKKSGRSRVNFTPADAIIRLEARVAMESAYLSDRYSTSFTPLWIIAFAHSLQGNRATYSRLPCKSRPWALRMAFSSAWTT